MCTGLRWCIVSNSLVELMRERAARTRRRLRLSVHG